MPTATRRGDLQVGGGFSANYPDYTRHKFYGYDIYADLDFFEHWGAEGEFRQTNDTSKDPQGNTVPQYQRNIEAGLRYHRTYGRLVPYAKGMFGYGQIEFPPYPAPASPTVSNGTAGYTFVAPGGGIDYVISPHITIRADMEYQIWFAKVNNGLGLDFYTNSGGIPNGLTPIVYTGGVAWRFGSGNYVPHGKHGDIY